MRNKRPSHLGEVVWRVIPAERQAVDLIKLASKLKAKVIDCASVQRHLIECVCHVSLDSKGIAQVVTLQKPQRLKPALAGDIEGVDILVIDHQTPRTALRHTKCIRAVCRAGGKLGKHTQLAEAGRFSAQPPLLLGVGRWQRVLVKGGRRAATQPLYRNTMLQPAEHMRRCTNGTPLLAAQS